MTNLNAHGDPIQRVLTRDKCIISKPLPNQRINWPWIFEMKANPKLILGWHKEHRKFWFVGGASCTR